MAKETNELIMSQVQADIWRCISGFTEMAVAKCAIELGISDFLESHQEPVPLRQLSTALGCSASSLYRILRFLINRGMFKLVSTGNGEMGYVQTPVSRLLKRDGENSMAALVLLESSPVMLAPWHYLSARVLSKENSTGAFCAAHGKDLWEYAKTNPEHSKLINDALACHARVTMHAIMNNCAEIFKGIESLVDVGGGNGTTVGMLVKAFPWINGINFDLTHVVSVAPPCHGVVHVEGDMFHSVPKAQAAFLMWVLHDWSDEECIKILKKCIEAIPKERGIVIIVEAVVDEKIGKEKGVKDVGLMLDMIMMAHTSNGKERSAKEWDHILSAAGFSSHSIRQTTAIEPLILAYP
ncbi:acetylserotonin O-methyltransferase-like [Solanum pennellii]|uniref:Acetylserotonin O-methyltransferase-like n=1 Tax=Solanum pennellii TaxID=28526 RepID=A0ABM1HB30_SOLPN|nr:acetylserotonin O-methyltransferase-like [Solanum pennellii]